MIDFCNLHKKTCFSVVRKSTGNISIVYNTQEAMIPQIGAKSALVCSYIQTPTSHCRCGFFLIKIAFFFKDTCIRNK